MVYSSLLPCDMHGLPGSTRTGSTARVDMALAQQPPAIGTHGLCRGAGAGHVTAEGQLCQRKSALQDPCLGGALREPLGGQHSPFRGFPIPKAVGWNAGTEGTLPLQSQRLQLPGVRRVLVPGPRAGTWQPRMVLLGRDGGMLRLTCSASRAEPRRNQPSEPPSLLQLRCS